MDIKKLKPSRKSNFKQGYYVLVNPAKYIGKQPIIYRSSWERKFCRWCDLNDDVISWASEPFAVKYFFTLDNKYHNYFPDFYIKMKGSEVIEYLVEIKPKAQLQKPQPPKKKTKKAIENFNFLFESYVKNLCKTQALQEMAEKFGYKIMLITEDSKLF
jgi:hypothetical protein